MARCAYGSNLSARRCQNMGGRNSLTRGSKQGFESVFGRRLIPSETAESPAKDFDVSKRCAEGSNLPHTTATGIRFQVSRFLAWRKKYSAATTPSDATPAATKNANLYPATSASPAVC